MLASDVLEIKDLDGIQFKMKDTRNILIARRNCVNMKSMKISLGAVVNNGESTMMEPPQKKVCIQEGYSDIYSYEGKYKK
ncbi:hypothetical protein Avbf_16621 [Armadillidium vulgare]|nr:hypothetical protein Avbf_16621 [Armadillidium vulgare]